MKGKKLTLLKWTIHQICMEFNFDPTTVAKKFKAASIEPSEENQYTTAQVVAGLFGQTEVSKARKMAAEADMKEQELAISQGTLISYELAMNYMSSLMVTIRQRIMHSALGEQEKRNILGEIETALSDGEASKRLIKKA